MNKESVIEFLKPNWRKTLLVVIIFVLFPVPIYVQSSGCFTEQLGAICEEYWTVMFIGLNLFDSILQGPIFSFEDIIILSFFIVSSYLLSCLIVYFYDKFKPLNKKFKQ